jgi:hypothetical protein
MKDKKLIKKEIFKGVDIDRIIKESCKRVIELYEKEIYTLNAEMFESNWVRKFQIKKEMKDIQRRINILNDIQFSPFLWDDDTEIFLN